MIQDSTEALTYAGIVPLGPLATTFQLPPVPYVQPGGFLGVLARPLAVNANQESMLAVQVNHRAKIAR